MVFNGKYLKSIIIVLVVGTSGFLTIPRLFVLPGSGLDNSWLLALNIAAANKFQFGKDIIFTYGPLGFLSYPLFYDVKLWVMSLTVNLFIHLLFFYSVVIMMMKSRTTIGHYLFMGVVLLIAIPIAPIDDKLFVAIIILLHLTITGQFDDKSTPFILIFASLLMAMGSLIKFTALLISLSILFFLFFFFIHKKQFKYFLYMLLTYILSVLLLWIIAGQRIANLPTYLFNSYQVAQGYNAAMSINGRMSQLYIGIFLIGVLVLTLLLSGLDGRFNVMVFILITSGFIFMSFKHAFVRHDFGHVQPFFVSMLLVLSFLYILHRYDICVLVRSLTLIVICILAFFIFKKNRLVVMPDFSGKISAVKSALSLAANASRHKEIIGQTKDMMRKGYSLNEETLRHIHSKSVDIFPWEAALTYAYDLRWFPRPVFQSYSAYTAKLDMLNARHFQGSDAPEIILYSLQSIDGRYPIFDEPATFRTLLSNYRPVSKDKEFIILEKRFSNDSFAEHTVLISNTALGEEIAIPKVDHGYLFARIHIDYNLLGNIANLFYKPPRVYFWFIDSGKIDRHRFVPSNAQNGIFLSQEINDQKGLYNVWDGKLIKNCDAIKISTSTPIFYKKDIKVEFFVVRREVKWIPEEVKWIPEEEPMQWDKIQKIDGGSFCIERINGFIDSKEILVDVSKYPKVTLTGWAVDERARDVASSVWLTLDGNPVAAVYYGTERADVAQGFKVATYKFSGWTTSVSFENITPGKHKISLRIVSKDKKSYYEPARGGVLIKVQKDK